MARFDATDKKQIEGEPGVLATGVTISNARVKERNGGYDIGQVDFITYANSVMQMAKAPCYELLTSPHTRGMPCLWGDGSVRTLGYTKDHTFNHSQMFGTPRISPPRRKR